MKNTTICKNSDCFLAWNANTSKIISSKLKPVYHLSWQCLSRGNVTTSILEKCRSSYYSWMQMKKLNLWKHFVLMSIIFVQS